MEKIYRLYKEMNRELYERIGAGVLAGALKVIPLVYRKITQSRFLPYLPKLNSDIGSGFFSIKANIGETTLLEPLFYSFVGNTIFGWPKNNKQIVRNTVTGYVLWEAFRIISNSLMPHAEIVPGEKPIDLPNGYSALMAGLGILEMYLIKKAVDINSE
jgi:hypothetical protein